LTEELQVLQAARLNYFLQQAAGADQNLTPRLPEESYFLQQGYCN